MLSDGDAHFDDSNCAPRLDFLFYRIMREINAFRFAPSGKTA
jgi:hypothetical protein